ncbi:MAG TPA: YtxH domain-containing protein [Bacteroidales bacterium]|nr:YtxH domain-containing protein [Bacteroidales bacterium]
MKTSRAIFSLVAGIAAGAAAGAAMGILYAPDKGTETRRKLSQRGEELRDNLKQKFEGVKEDANDLLEKGKSKMYEAKNDINSATI